MQVRIPQLFEEMQTESALQGSRHNCYASDDNTRIIEHQSVVFRSSLRNLCVLCASAVYMLFGFFYRRRAKDAEITQS